MDLSLAYPWLEAVPDRTFKLAFWCAIGGKSAAGRISRGVLDASERLMANSPYGEKAHRKI